MMLPKDFLWGVACASYQCEGAWDEDGKGRNIWDDFTHVPGNIQNGDTGDRACDSYHRWAEDVRLMKQFGIQAYRFSISWARIIPDGDGAVNEKGLEFYDNLVNALIASGIKPMITLYHWDLPSALQDKGGWLNRDIVPAFGRYARVIAEHFKGRVDTYMTLNEPQCVTVGGYVSGNLAPGWKLGEVPIGCVIVHDGKIIGRGYNRRKTDKNKTHTQKGEGRILDTFFFSKAVNQGTGTGERHPVLVHMKNQDPARNRRTDICTHDHAESLGQLHDPGVHKPDDHRHCNGARLYKTGHAHADKNT